MRSPRICSADRKSKVIHPLKPEVVTDCNNHFVNRYCKREGKSVHGCPIAKYIVRRPNESEKFVVIVKDRVGHRCENKWIVVSIIAWDGVPRKIADETYDHLSTTLGRYGN